MKLSRKLSIILSILYIAVVAIATVNCVSTYYRKLPTAYLAEPITAQILYDGEKIKSVGNDMYAKALPRTCLQNDGSGKMKVNMIAEEDGPWGKRYIIKQTDTAYWPVDSDSKYIVILFRLDDSLPIAADISSGYAYEGMEVKLALYEQ